MALRKYSLKVWQLLGIAFVVATCAFVDAGFFYFAMSVEADHVAAFGRYMAHPMWHDDGEVPSVYFGSNRVRKMLYLCR